MKKSNEKPKAAKPLVKLGKWLNIEFPNREKEDPKNIEKEPKSS